MRGRNIQNMNSFNLYEPTIKKKTENRVFLFSLSHAKDLVRGVEGELERDKMRERKKFG